MKSNLLMKTALFAAVLFSSFVAPAQIVPENATENGLKLRDIPVASGELLLAGANPWTHSPWMKVPERPPRAPLPYPGQKPPISLVNPWTGWEWMEYQNQVSSPVVHRLTLSARFGLNISARFGSSGVTVPPSTLTTPSGQSYNYDDGYVLPDVSGSGDGYTWYWGYNDSSSQLDAGGNRILLHQSAGSTAVSGAGSDDEVSPGFEVAYTRELGTTEDFRYGFVAALNYLNIAMGASSPYVLRAPRDTYAFNYTPGTTPPTASPGNEYQGTYDGPGFVIDANGTLVDSSLGAVGTATGSRDYDGNLWGGRLGPYAECSLADDVSVIVSGGLALGWLHSSVSWNETLAFTSGSSVLDVGRGSDDEFLWGGYVAADIYWRLSERWSAAASVQFQSLGNYDEAFGTRRVELDLGKSIFFNIGLGYNF